MTTKRPGAQPKQHLPGRLRLAAEMIPAGRRRIVADVATGRGELAIHLVASGVSQKVVAVDVSAKAVRILAAIVAEHGLGRAIEVRRGDGLAALLPGEVDTVMITGIGGRLMVRLLGQSPAILSPTPASASGGSDRSPAPLAPALVLQPQTEPAAVRDWAMDRAPEFGYVPVAERLAQDRGRFYHAFLVMHRAQATEDTRPPGAAVAAAQAWADPLAVDELGPYLLDGREPLLGEYIAWRRQRLANLATKAGRGDDEAAAGRARAALAREAALAAVQSRLNIEGGGGDRGLPG